MTTATRTAPSPDLNARKIEQGTALVYCWELVGKFWAKGYRGKSAKAAFYFTFRSETQRDEYVAKFLADTKASEEYRANLKREQKAARAAMHNATDLPIGTIMVSSWGWEQTNIDFFKVVGHFGRTGLEVVAIGSQRVEGSVLPHGMADHVVADPDVDPEATVHRVKMTSKNGFRVPEMTGDYTARKWDGSPLYRSWYA